MSERSKFISRLRGDKKFRTAYIKAKLGVLVPAQIRALRLKSTAPAMPRQKDLAQEADMHQSRISMFETPGAANVTLETLATIASALKCGLVVQFVPFSKMLKWENSFSQDNFDVTRIDEDIEFISPGNSVAPAKIQAIGYDNIALRLKSHGVDLSNLWNDGQTRPTPETMLSVISTQPIPAIETSELQSPAN